MYLIFGSSSFVAKHLQSFLVEKGEKLLFVNRSPQNNDDGGISISQFLSMDGHQCKDLISSCKGIIYCIGNSNPYAYEGKLHEEIEVYLPLVTSIAQKVALVSQSVPFIFLSSAGMVYSKHLNLRYENSPTNPESSYGYVKYLSERTLQFIGENYHLNYCILRLSNPVGKWHRNSKQGVFGVLNNAFKNKQTFTLIGDGSQKRDFIDCDDVAAAIYKSIEYIAKENDPYRIFNIAKGECVSINSIIDELRLVYDYDISILYSKAPSNHPDAYTIDISRAHKYLNWFPESSLSDIIRKLL